MAQSTTRFSMRWITRLGAIVLFGTASPALAQVQERRIATNDAAEAAAWNARLQAMADAGEIRLVRSREDALVPDRRHHRYAQLHRSVPVRGGELVVQSGSQGVVSVFGTLYD
ncbi:MAG TPA: hypothetical protein VKA01_05270, partial [Vicinamibacteria bacterium]|nr:hypothetical protein [Vicinamibacteria bacterium]